MVTPRDLFPEAAGRQSSSGARKDEDQGMRRLTRRRRISFEGRSERHILSFQSSSQRRSRFFAAGMPHLPLHAFNEVGEVSTVQSLNMSWHGQKGPGATLWLHCWLSKGSRWRLHSHRSFYWWWLVHPRWSARHTAGPYIRCSRSEDPSRPGGQREGKWELLTRTQLTKS